MDKNVDYLSLGAQCNLEQGDVFDAPKESKKKTQLECLIRVQSRVRGLLARNSHQAVV